MFVMLTFCRAKKLMVFFLAQNLTHKIGINIMTEIKLSIRKVYCQKDTY